MLLALPIMPDKQHATRFGVFACSAQSGALAVALGCGNTWPFSFVLPLKNNACARFTGEPFFRCIIQGGQPARRIRRRKAAASVIRRQVAVARGKDSIVNAVKFLWKLYCPDFHCACIDSIEKGFRALFNKNL